MSDPAYARLRAVFHEVADLPHAEREARIDALCAGEPETAREVRRLLQQADTPAAHTRAVGSASVFAADGSMGHAMGGAGTPGMMPEVEGYRVIRLIGEGGMGAVYEAEQVQPRRRVALKFIRAGLVTPSLRRRFEHEAEALARLQHPGIAQVYQVGVGRAAAGQAEATPFIAMELVEGEPVTAAARGLDTRARLELLCRICRAVHHAHQRGVVHRDLKPANVLLNRAGEIKVLDFGVARIVQSERPATTMHTEAGQILGTAAYMSPEQAGGDAQKVDARSDVYALGVLGFELLSGKLPHDVSRLALPDAIRTIREEDATRLGTVVPALRGDVETIIAKATEREPGRRYASAEALAEDVQRYLDSKPIVARPATTLDQAIKFAKRHKVLVGASAAVFAALTAGLAGTATALGRESAARRQAEQAADRETLAAREAEAATAREATARKQAEQASARFRTTSQFLEDVLSGLNPRRAQGRDTALLMDMLERAVTEQSGISDPVVRADLLRAIGRTYASIFEYQLAAERLTESIGLLEAVPADARQGFAAELNESRLRLADVLPKLDRHGEARTLLDAALADAKARKDTAQQAGTLLQLADLTSVQGDAAGALALLDEGLALRTNGEGEEAARDRARMEMLRGSLLRRLRRPAEARAALEAALARLRGPTQQIERATVINSLAMLSRDAGDLPETERLLREALALRQEADPRPNPDSAAMLANLGRVLVSSGRDGEAVPVLNQALEMHVQIYGENNAATAMPMVSLAQVQSVRGEHEAALATVTRALKVFRNVHPANHPSIVTALAEQANMLLRAQRFDEAEKVAAEGLAMADELKLDPRVYQSGLYRLHAAVAGHRGRFVEARGWLTRALEVLPPNSPAAQAAQRQLDNTPLEDRPAGAGSAGAGSAGTGSTGAGPAEPGSAGTGAAGPK